MADEKEWKTFFIKLYVTQNKNNTYGDMTETKESVIAEVEKTQP